MTTAGWFSDAVQWRTISQIDAPNAATAKLRQIEKKFSKPEKASKLEVFFSRVSDAGRMYAAGRECIRNSEPVKEGFSPSNYHFLTTRTSAGSERSPGVAAARPTSSISSSDNVIVFLEILTLSVMSMALSPAKSCA